MQVALEARVAREQLATQVLKVPQERQVSHHVESFQPGLEESIAKLHILQ